MFDALLPSFVALLVLLDPVALAPIFLALTSGADARERARIARRAALTAFLVLAAFGLFGRTIIGLLGIGIPAFRISGGVMLFMIATEMLFEKRSQRRSNSAQNAQHEAIPGLDRDPSIFPIGTPLLAGPGAMATMILLMDKAGPRWTEQALVLGALAATVLITWVFLTLSSALAHRISPSMINVLTRVFGVLLGAMAVQFILDGLADYGVFVRHPR